jgi:ribonucleoside-diphosphate reductase alpha chain
VEQLAQPNLTTIGENVLAKRYLVRNETGDVVETPQERFANVAKHVARAERNYGVEPDSIWPRFYRLMAKRDFMPNTPCLVNAGRDDNPGQLSACFVLPIEDSMEGIFTTLRDMAMIHKTGGGTGFSFSRLRPAGDFVKSTTGIASGPVSFMRAYNHVTECVKQSGVRRGANMGILRIDHPDILSFIDCKRDPNELCNFNISVGVTNAFMKAVDEDTEYELVNPRTKEVTGTLRARDVWNHVVKNAHASGEPGLFFLDRVNELDPLAGAVGEVEACNPCGEVPLRPYDACDLGSINLANFYLDDAVGAKIDFKRLEEVIQDAVRFLDDVHDVNQYPVSQIHEQTRASRKIGLGVMGWADLLVKMGIPYGSQQALDLAEEVERFIATKAVEASEELAALRGPFPLFEKSKHFTNGRKHRRNATCTVIAPTGSISIIAGCSSGIEPLFAIVQTRKQADMEMVDVNPMFIEVAKREGFYSEELLERVKENGTVKDDPDVPSRWQRVFAIANEISPEYHIRMQAAFQRHVEDAVSKCLAAGTLIPTSMGLVPVESFSDVTADDTFQKLDQSVTTGGHRILSHYRLGIGRAVRIKLDNGAVLTGAEATHRVQTADGWKLMRDLKIGDVVLGRFMAAHGPGDATIQWSDEWHTNASRIATPKAMTPPLAEWLGMLCADGHTVESTGQVGLSCKDEEVEARFITLTNEVFNVSPRTVEDRRTGVRCVYLTSRNLVRYVEALIGKGAFEKRAPIQVLQGSADEKRAFLRGVTLDGYLVRGALCVYGGMSETLAYHVAELARSFGLPSVYQGHKGAPGGVFHYVILSNAAQEIVQCIEKHKNAQPASTSYKVLLDRAVLDQHVPTDHPHYGAVRSLRQETGRHYCTNRVAHAMGWSTDTPVYLVRAVEDAGLVEMFDIEVESAHEYVVNGIVSHNTINLPEGATVEDVEQAYRMAWDEGCKGITVYRDKSREGQTLTIGASIARPELHPIPTGVYDLLGQMVKTPTGKLSVKVGLDTNDRPFETWLAVSRAGTAVSADCEAIARLGSLVLRMDSPIKPERRLQLIADQLSGIGGGDSVGFGQDRVLSLPDGVAKALRSLAESLEARQAAKTITPVEALAKAVTAPPVAVKPSNGHSNGNGKSNGNGHKHRFGDICPDCHQVALYYGEGCAKCALCGFSRC